MCRFFCVRRYGVLHIICVCVCVCVDALMRHLSLSLSPSRFSQDRLVWHTKKLQSIKLNIWARTEAELKMTDTTKNKIQKSSVLSLRFAGRGRARPSFFYLFSFIFFYLSSPLVFSPVFFFFFSFSPIFNLFFLFFFFFVKQDLFGPLFPSSPLSLPWPTKGHSGLQSYLITHAHTHTHTHTHAHTHISHITRQKWHCCCLPPPRAFLATCQAYHHLY